MQCWANHHFHLCSTLLFSTFTLLEVEEAELSAFSWTLDRRLKKSHRSFLLVTVKRNMICLMSKFVLPIPQNIPPDQNYPTWSKISHLIKNISPDQEKTKIDADNTDVWVPPLLPQWQRSVRINFDCCAQIRFDNALRGFTCFWKTPNQRLPELPQTEHLLSCFSAHFSEDCDSHSTLYYFLKILRPSRHFLPFLQPHSEMERLPADLWQFDSLPVNLVLSQL